MLITAAIALLTLALALPAAWVVLWPGVEIDDVFDGRERR
ncbi:hypothetical protein Lepto7375DRAFT_0603 [Leptolyngbya sp. PCC 7375]|nr:hypothetical protein Lepto7375DRAFT_0603 [Leptolyngbya sp. PCC 7375]